MWCKCQKSTVTTTSSWRQSRVTNVKCAAPTYANGFALGPLSAPTLHSKSGSLANATPSSILQRRGKRKLRRIESARLTECTVMMKIRMNQMSTPACISVKTKASVSSNSRTITTKKSRLLSSKTMRMKKMARVKMSSTKRRATSSRRRRRRMRRRTCLASKFLSTIV